MLYFNADSQNTIIRGIALIGVVIFKNVGPTDLTEPATKEPDINGDHSDTHFKAVTSVEIHQDDSHCITSAELKHDEVSAKRSSDNTIRCTMALEEEVATSQKKFTIQPVPVEEFAEYVAKNSDEFFNQQFNVTMGVIAIMYVKTDIRIVFEQSLDTGDEFPKTVGTSKENAPLNRYTNITVCELYRLLSH